ncbi:hypothetical protein [Stenotrophomonas sp.]|uniref:hypothetical protein n=1 Tax=Stenotrophomonas sp. TaxID=69392 RepID=UPI0028ABD841|nr:hypothetical protein [Stenotrophomonas sp.]
MRNKIILAVAIAAVCAGVIALIPNAPRSLKQGDTGFNSSIAGLEYPGSTGSRISSGTKQLFDSHALDPAYTVSHGKRGFNVIRTGPLRPEGDALAYVQSLLPASRRGSANATFNIFLASLDCKRSYTGSAHGSEAGQSSLESLKECEALLSDKKLLDMDWLTEAAEQGSIEAMTMYSINPDYVLPGGPKSYLRDPEAVQRWKSNAKTYLEKAAMSGSQDAFIAISNGYSNGVIYEYNPVSELGYAMAAEKISPIPGFEEAYRPIAKGLSPMQLRQSESLSEALYKQCCME